MHRLLLVVALVVGGCAARAAAPRGLDAALSAYPYPYPVEILRVSAQDQPLELAFMDVPAGGAARGTVVLLHGKNFSGAYWKRTIATLVADGYRVLVPDQIGFGKSSKPLTFQYSFHELAQLTRRLLDARGVERAIIVGHSMGGMLAVRFARSFPERTRALVLVNPIGLEDWQAVVPYRGIAELTADEAKRTPASIKAYFSKAYFGGQWSPAFDELLDLQVGWALGPDRERIGRVSALTSDMVFTQPVVHELPLITAPTLLVIGQRDKTAIGKDRAPAALRDTLGDYPTLGKAAAAAIPNAQLVELDNVGHVPQAEAFERWSDALRTFLRAQP